MKVNIGDTYYVYHGASLSKVEVIGFIFIDSESYDWYDICYTLKITPSSYRKPYFASMDLPRFKMIINTVDYTIYKKIKVEIWVLK